jgi:hypothetical protein
MNVLSCIPALGASAALLLGAATPVAAQTSGQSPAWTAGPGAALTNTYQGFIDTPTQGATVPTSGTLSVSGWFVDTTAQGWAGADNVQVFVGQMNNGGTMLAQGVVGQNRPDVATALGNPYWSASGFSVQIPAASLPAGNQTLGVYLHTPDKGWWYEPLTVNVAAGTGPAAAPSPSPSTSASVVSGPPQLTVSSPTEGQDVSTKRDFTITGTVSEPGMSASDIDRVSVYINGEADTGTLLGDTTPASDGSWSVTFTPTHFSATHSNIYVYAHSRGTGRTTETIRGFNITDR